MPRGEAVAESRLLSVHTGWLRTNVTAAPASVPPHLVTFTWKDLHLLWFMCICVCLDVYHVPEDACSGQQRRLNH